jgi:HrpA-like RNA helicase
MPSHTSPEMLRSPLESVVLLIKGLAVRRQQQQQQGDRTSSGGGGGGGGGKMVAEVLAQCLSPPDPVAVSGAVRLLQHIGALDGGEGLTPLGHHLNAMPMDPR